MDHSSHSMNNRHLLIMLICCLVPLVAFAVITVLGVPLTSLGYVILILLCPLGHLLLMRFVAEPQDKAATGSSSDGRGGTAEGGQGGPTKCH